MNTIFTINHSYPEEFTPYTEVVGVAATHAIALAMATASAKARDYPFTDPTKVFPSPDWEAFKKEGRHFVYVEEVMLNCFINEHDQRDIHFEAPVPLQVDVTATPTSQQILEELDNCLARAIHALTK